MDMAVPLVYLMESLTVYAFIHSDLSQVEQVAALLSDAKYAKGGW
jgi:hypothetical protein